MRFSMRFLRGKGGDRMKGGKKGGPKAWGRRSETEIEDGKRTKTEKERDGFPGSVVNG